VNSSLHISCSSVYYSVYSRPIPEYIYFSPFLQCMYLLSETLPSCFVDAYQVGRLFLCPYLPNYHLRACSQASRNSADFSCLVKSVAERKRVTALHMTREDLRPTLHEVTKTLPVGSRRRLRVRESLSTVFETEFREFTLTSNQKFTPLVGNVTIFLLWVVSFCKLKTSASHTDSSL